MPEQLLALQAYLDGLARRERRLLLLQALLQGLAAVLLLGVAGALALSLGLSRADTLGWVGALGGVGLWLALAWPLLPRWRPSGDTLRQAHLVEGALPELRSRLLTAVERGASGEGGPLLARAAARARDLVAGLEPRRVHSARGALRAALLVVVALVAWVLAAVVLPVGPVDAWRVALGASAAEARLAGAGAELQEERALVGDIVLRYVYPAYTGLEPIEVPNSDGTIHAPPGTVVQISARTAERFDAAALQAYEAAPEDARLSGGRDLAASLLVEGDGTWRFVLFKGKEVVQSPDYRILAEADAPPVVAVEKPGSSLPVDRALPMRWSVQDDYGIKRVVLEIEQDGVIREVELRTPLDGPTELRGRLRMSPRELGLKPGDEATLRVVAYDNDLLGGEKRGVSPDLEVEISGPRSGGQRLTRYHEALRDALLVALADFLEEGSPALDSPRAMTAWTGEVRRRLEPVQAIYEEQWQGEQPDGVDGTLVQRVLERAARLVRFTLTTFDGNGGRRLTSQDRQTFAELRAEEIEALEQAVYVIDSMLRQLALGEVAQAAERVSQEAQELAAIADDAEAAELLARLDQLQRLMSELAQAAQQLSDGQLSEFVNSRTAEAMSLIDEIRKAIAEGRLDDAREMLKQLAQQLQQLSEGLNERMAAQQQGEDQLREAYEELQAELQQLEADQQQLAEELAQAREEQGSDLSELMEAWAEVERLSEQAIAQSARARDATGDGTGWRTGSLRSLERLAEGTAQLRDPVRARDALGALDAALGSQLPWDASTRALGYERSRSRPASEPLPDGLRTADEAVARVGADLRELIALLQELSQQDSQDSPQLQQLARQLAEQQRSLEERQQRLERQVQGMERQMPTGDGTAAQSMEQAGEAMDRAGQQLERGQASSGEGHQRDAAGQLQQTREALERQMAEYQQMQRSMQQMRGQQQGEGGEGDSPEGEGSGEDRRVVEIPAPEDFQTPEEYRRALLEGMSGDVPDEYEALKRRYYEDLVRQ